ncbi:MAG: membrane protein insertase YidC [Candidatus Cloacimonetes bacterium]|nr:membrane protein insertase YidC [Candidatus Cloacimonadota bacterium]
MDKRTITALLMMLVLYLVFDHFVWKPRRDNARIATQNSEVVESPQSSQNPHNTITDSTDQALAATVNVDSLFIQSAEAEILFLENENIKVGFNTKGAVINSIQLKHFDFGPENLVDLIPNHAQILGANIYSGGNTIDLSAYNFNYTLNEQSRSIEFSLASANDAVVKRVYRLDEQYGIIMDTNIQNIGSVNGVRYDLLAGIADSENNTKSKAQDYRFYLYADNEILKVTLSKMRKNPPQGSFGSYAWSAVRSKYFTLALKENEPPLSKSFNTQINDDTGNPGFAIDSFSAESKANWQQSFVLYAGPADAKILKSYGRQMENIAERGASWLRWLANIIAWFLSWLHGYIQNYGVVILILALVIKIILHPLTHKSMDASLKMQKIQPQMQYLQKKYKDDPKTLQLEMSKLYKEAGANPLSGCLPLLLQMPIFFALYNVLRYSLDMRNAGFIFWLKDLSEPDPYMILPIIMGLFMIIQSLMMQPKKIQTEDMDDKQKAAQSSQKMMTWMMPIMMFFIFRNMPAGLVLYWTVFNIFSVIQQYYLLKRHNKE